MSAGAGGRVRLEIDGPIAVITLDRPAKLNALTLAMLDELARAAEAIERNDEVRAAILAGAGARAFCAGADIDAWGGLSALDMGRRWVRDGHAVFDRLAGLRQPLIAAVAGVALGGGLELAATADLRVVEDQARLGLPETSIGVVPGWSGTQRLAALIGTSRVKRLAFTGDPVDAHTALAMGLADEVCKTGAAMDQARALAARIAERAPAAVQLAKQIINAGAGKGLDMTLEALAVTVAAATEDCREGVAAFRDKRAPTFRNT